ncbi:hypothetical protein P6P90_16245 [Ectobacillus antri]|jgi:hypothetical protein|uniref:Uncharacterized protein n=1 Tax=Ectobacillus antri TaxID=2486280 RepID=A0ABT6H900_9BACI|nr:hypothetical protein [Ectobacillus antri]MDG4658469.1 hypothetical protein [Ectobacillus antri]MDG5755452.1 hypothetical protein [Ectobacillus antri]
MSSHKYDYREDRYRSREDKYKSRDRYTDKYRYKEDKRYKEREQSQPKDAVRGSTSQTPASKHEECVDRAFRLPVFLSTTNTLNAKQQSFLDRLILEMERALLFPRTGPITENYPESILTNVRRLVSSSYGMLALNFRRYYTEVLDTNVGPPVSTDPFWQGSSFAQIEPAMAFQRGIPILLVREAGTDLTNGLWLGGIPPLNTLIEWDSDNQSVDEFFSSIPWRSVFANWSAEVRNAYFLQTNPDFKY